ncbi:MAG: MazG nucleotide pyrophosphohydrolase domain-containing protein [Sulfolobales archaeon]
MSLTIAKVQEIIKKYYYEKDSARGLHATFTWFVEEVGELADALLSNNRTKIEEEIADVFAWLISIANLLDIDVETCFKKKYLS